MSKVSNKYLANVPADSLKGNNTGSTSQVQDLTSTQVTAMLDAFVGDSGSGGLQGLVPAPASGDAAALKFLMADGTWTVPSGSSGVGGSTGSVDQAILIADGTGGSTLQASPILIDPSTGYMTLKSNSGTTKVYFGPAVAGYGLKLEGGQFNFFMNSGIEQPQVLIEPGNFYHQQNGKFIGGSGVTGFYIIQSRDNDQFNDPCALFIHGGNSTSAKDGATVYFRSGTSDTGNAGDILVQTGLSNSGAQGKMSFSIGGVDVLYIPNDSTGLQLLDQKVMKFMEPTGTGSNYVGIKGPSSIGTSYTVTLPATAPTAGQLLGFDGTNYLWEDEIEAEFDNGGSGTVDFNNGQVQLITLASAQTFTPTNMKSGGSYPLRVIQDGTGGWVMTWPGSITWINPGAVAPATGGPTTNLFVNLYCYDGTNFWGTYVQGY